jgi:hypothetical protein
LCGDFSWSAAAYRRLLRRDVRVHSIEFDKLDATTALVTDGLEGSKTLWRWIGHKTRRAERCGGSGRRSGEATRERYAPAGCADAIGRAEVVERFGSRRDDRSFGSVRAERCEGDGRVCKWRAGEIHGERAFARIRRIATRVCRRAGVSAGAAAAIEVQDDRSCEKRCSSLALWRGLPVPRRRNGPRDRHEWLSDRRRYAMPRSSLKKFTKCFQTR